MPKSDMKALFNEVLIPHKLDHPLVQLVNCVFVEREGTLRLFECLAGCAFAPRCDNAEDDCLTEVSGSIVPLEYAGPGRELRCRHPLEYPPSRSGATVAGAAR